MSAPELWAAVEESRAERRRRWLLTQRARAAVTAAVRNGQLHRPASCTRCPNGGPVLAHHFMGYEERHWLSVLWLCHDCHAFASRVERMREVES